MANEHMKFPPEVARIIESRWTEDTQRHGPSPDVLDTLLTTCFFASLQREEGRDTQFDLAYCDEADLSSKTAFRYSKFTFVNSVFRLTQPRPLCVNELVRLAPSCDPDRTLILVQVRENALQIWGIVDIGSDRSMGSIALNELRIRVIGSGHFEVMSNGLRLCVFKGGKIIEVKRDLINEGCLYDSFKESSFDLSRAVKRLLGDPDWNNPVSQRQFDAMAYFEALDQLITSMQRLSHGGCILMVDNSESDLTTSDITIKYDCKNEQSPVWTALTGLGVMREKASKARGILNQLPCDLEELFDIELMRNDIERGLTDSVEAIARFSAVDGAVLLNKKFELLGFGAVIQLTNSKRYDVFRCEDRLASDPKRINLEEYGTRHRSAFEFCYQFPSSVAFVASQDGGIKGVRRVGEAIHFWEGISFSIQHERP